MLLLPASFKSEVKLLTLSKEDYDDMKDRFPDARDQLIDNVRAILSLGKAGQLNGQKVAPSPLQIAGGGEDMI